MLFTLLIYFSHLFHYTYSLCFTKFCKNTNQNIDLCRPQTVAQLCTDDSYNQVQSCWVNSGVVFPLFITKDLGKKGKDFWKM